MRGAAVVVLAVTLGLGALAAAQAQVRLLDASEINSLGYPESIKIDSVATVVAHWQCFTPQEKTELDAYLRSLARILREDLSILAKSQTIPGQSSDGALGAAVQAASTRIRNDLSAIDRLRLEIFNKPNCPGTPSTAVRVYIGGYLVKLSLGLEVLERLAATGEITNDLKARKDPLGSGFVVGATFVPWSNNVVVSPFASFEYLNMSVNTTTPPSPSSSGACTRG